MTTASRVVLSLLCSSVAVLAQFFHEIKTGAVRQAEVADKQIETFLAREIERAFDAARDF